MSTEERVDSLCTTIRDAVLLIVRDALAEQAAALAIQREQAVADALAADAITDAAERQAAVDAALAADAAQDAIEVQQAVADALAADAVMDESQTRAAVEAALAADAVRDAEQLAAAVNAAASEAIAKHMIPGTGWTAATPQPASVGDPAAPGYDAKAIARWDVVPFQTFDGTFGIGIPAFHMNGIDRVEFSVNGGPWLAVREMTLNPWSNVVEYWAVLRASDFSTDGQIEVRAIAYPKCGVPRVLESMYLFADPHRTFSPGAVYVSLVNGSDANTGTLSSPFATINYALRAVPDGGEVVLLDAGTYTVGYGATHRLNKRWITVRPTDRLTRNQVVIAGINGQMIRPRVFLHKWSNITLDLSTTWQYSTMPGDHIWFDNSVWTYGSWTNTTHPNGQQYPAPIKEWVGGLWVTNSLAYDVFYGFVLADLVRHSRIERCSGDAYQSVKLVINSSAKDVDGNISAHHTDLFQWWGIRENIIVYGFEAVDGIEAQSIFLWPNNSVNASNNFRGFAFVDVRIRNIVHPDGFVRYYSHMAGPQSHIYFRNLWLESQEIVFRTDAPAPNTLVPVNVVFENSRLHVMMIARNPPAGVSYQNMLPSHPLYTTNITASTTAAHTVRLNHALDAAAIPVLVTGPNGYQAAATVVGSTRHLSQTIYTYSIPSPAGGWQASANGVYVLSSPAIGELGGFSVTVA